MSGLDREHVAGSTRLDTEMRLFLLVCVAAGLLVSGCGGFERGKMIRLLWGVVLSLLLGKALAAGAEEESGEQSESSLFYILPVDPTRTPYDAIGKQNKFGKDIVSVGNGQFKLPETKVPLESNRPPGSPGTLGGPTPPAEAVAALNPGGSFV